MSVYPHRHRQITGRRVAAGWRIVRVALGAAALACLVAGFAVLIRAPVGYLFLGVALAVAAAALIGLCAAADQRIRTIQATPPPVLHVRETVEGIDSAPTTPLWDR